MATRKLLGYFLKIGSQDYPLNMSPNEKFGWDLDANGNSTVGPLFKYSLNDVEKAFDKVRQIQIEWLRLTVKLTRVGLQQVLLVQLFSLS